MHDNTPLFPGQRASHRVTRPLGDRRRKLALVVLAIGLLSFFFPLITTNPPVLSTTHWSAASITTQIFRGALPNPDLRDACARCDSRRILLLLFVPKSAAAIYLLLIGALVVLGRSRSAAFLTLIGGTGALLTWEAWRSESGVFQALFYGHMFPGRVQVGVWIVLVLLVMVALLVISRVDSLDGPA